MFPKLIYYFITDKKNLQSAFNMKFSNIQDHHHDFNLFENIGPEAMQ